MQYEYILIDVGTFALAAAILACITFYIKNKKRNENTPQMEPFNPLRSMTFDELISGTVPTSRVQEDAANHIAAQLTFNGGDAAKVASQLGDLVAGKGAYVARFSAKVQTQMAKGNAVLMKQKDGAQLMIAVDKPAGKIIEAARVTKGGAAAARLANVAAIVVATSHVVAGYDNAKSLRSIGGRLDVVVRRQEHQLLSRLESIFETLQERLEGGMDRLILLQIKSDLKEMRNMWLHETEAALLAIDDPDANGKIKKWFNRVFLQNKKIAKRIDGEVSAQEQHISLIRVAIFLEQVVSHNLGEMDAFEKVVVPTVQRRIDRIDQLFRESRVKIAKLVGSTTEEVDDHLRVFVRFKESLDHRESRLDDGEVPVI